MTTMEIALFKTKLTNVEANGVGKHTATWLHCTFGAGPRSAAQSRGTKKNWPHDGISLARQTEPERPKWQKRTVE